MREIGLEEVQVQEKEHHVPLDQGRAWSLVLGSGYRHGLVGLDEGARALVRVRLDEVLEECGMTTLDATTLVGVGRRDGWVG